MKFPQTSAEGNCTDIWNKQRIKTNQKNPQNKQKTNKKIPLDNQKKCLHVFNLELIRQN